MGTADKRNRRQYDKARINCNKEIFQYDEFQPLTCATDNQILKAFEKENYI